MEKKAKTHPFIDTEKASFFHKPFSLLLSQEDFNKDMPAYFKRMKNTGDDRSLAIFSALLLEEHISRQLLMLLPGYKKLSENQNVTFSLKITLLQSFKLLPDRVFSFVNMLRKVRNEFAHELSLEKFDDISISQKKSIDDFYEQINHFEGYKEPSSLTEKFYNLTVFTLSGLRFYEINIKIMREVMESAEFKERIKFVADQKTIDMFDTLTKKKKS